MGKKFRNFIIMGLSTLFLFGVLNQCSPERMDEENTLNETALNSANNFEEAYNLGNKYDSYVFTGADFILDGNYYNVGINGLATTEENNMHYVNMRYKVDCNFIDAIDPTVEKEVIKALTTIIDTYGINNYSYFPVESLDSVSSSARNIVDYQSSGYTLNKSFVYGLGELLFDSEKNQISFNVSQNLEYKNSDNEVKRVTSINRIILNCTKEEFTNLVNDNSLILTYFIDVVNNNRISKYSVEKINQTFDKEFNDGSAYSYKDINK